jgi:L-alanine-DL-glutamate epimerase-like enolase superfamily enzyme
MKVGALDFAEELRLLAELRRLYPPERIELRLDANGAFSPKNALARLHTLAQFDIFAIEQPLKPGQAEEMAALCAQSPIPIALDEELIGRRTSAAKKALLKRIHPQHIVLKPTLLGGFAAAEAWIEAAEEMGIGWWVNSALESNIGLNALCQWTAQRKPDFVHGLGTGQLYSNNVASPVALRSSRLFCAPEPFQAEC